MKPSLQNKALEGAVSFEHIDYCLRQSKPAEKITDTTELYQAAVNNGLQTDTQASISELFEPGRPERPELVAPSQLARRRLGSDQGRAALIHAISHIEFNAINLALDAAWRFRDLPEEFTLDWLSVAADEARHFEMLQNRLTELGFAYGDFPAHNGLWEISEKTAGSCLERMALVPRVLEARGLDVTPGMISRLKKAGDTETISILEIILEEEVRHVEIGSRWFKYCCNQVGVNPEETFLDLLRRHYSGRIRGPFNIDDRLRAGFTKQELSALEAL